jgi:hypothetical protein
VKKLLVLAPILPVLAVLFALGGPPVTPVYACTGPTDDLTLDHYVSIADVIAVVDVSTVGGAANETPPLAPGTPLDTRVGGGIVPNDFDFAGYRAKATVKRVIAGSISGAIEIDAAVRAYLEGVVRRWEAGERLAPCFFGGQHRYQPSTSYLVFLGRSDVGWDTIAAYPVFGTDVVVAVGSEAAPYQKKHLIVGNDTHRRFFSSIAARNSGSEFTDVYGDLWWIEQQSVPLDTMTRAITSLRASITPPTTGDGGLR